MTSVVVVGATGFVGSAVVRALRDHGAHVREVRAPRVICSRLPREWARARGDFGTHVRDTAVVLSAADVVVNAAGIADAGSTRMGDLVGANSVLPAVLAEAAVVANVRRFVHISSAAVHGRDALLDETVTPHPFSPYSRSKELGERLVHEAAGSHVELAILRPTSVHGAGRNVTRTLARFARSPLSSVAGDGTQRSPQVRVSNVAAAAVFLVTSQEVPIGPALQPSEGMTAASVLRALGLGREPRHVPRPMAHAVTRVLRAGERVRPSLVSHVRRLEMLWLGQDQRPGWLERAGFVPEIDHAAWVALGRESALGTS